MSMRLIVSLTSLSLVLFTADRSSASNQAPWDRIKSKHFVVHFVNDRDEAVKVGQRCEELRQELGKTWTGGKALADWTALCHVVVHPSTASYRATLGPGAELSAGCSSVNVEHGRVVSRRIDLNGEDRARMYGVMAHEMTHVVLADLFADQKAPRWADEGMAMLAEASEKKQLRLDDLHAALERGVHFNLDDLLLMDDYPAPRRQQAFYAQSISLVSFLVEQGTQEQFVRFLKLAAKHGYAVALEQQYRISSVAELERRWLRHVETRRLALAR